MIWVEAHFEAELPFWICMNDGIYGIYVDGKPCPTNGKPWEIRVYNDRWLIEMGNQLDRHTPMIAILPTKLAKKSEKLFPDQPYYHKRKMRTVLVMGFKWKLKDKSTTKDAKEHVNKHWQWCTNTFIKSTNRFIDIYRTSGTEDKVPTSVGLYDLSFNWWHTLVLDNKIVERVRLGLDAYPVIQNPPVKVNKDIQEEIVGKLASLYEPATWKLIIENGMSYNRRGKYRMAVIEMYSGFELFMINFLKRKYNDKGYDNQLINYLMNRTELNDGFDRVGRTLTSPTSHTTVHAGHAYGGSGQFNIFTPLLIQTK